MKALLIGSISTLADTSEMQRRAFNRAFLEAGLEWYWHGADYRARLETSGGRDRIAAFAKEQNTVVDADALHARKTVLFQEELRAGGATLRPQTQAILEYVRLHDLRAAFVTGTDKASIDALLQGFGGAQALGFDLVTCAQATLAPKPDPALYQYALTNLGLAAGDVLAIEDNRAGVDAAQAAGITVLAYPNENTADHDFSDVDTVEVWSALLSQKLSA